MRTFCEIFGHKFKPRYSTVAPKWMDHATELNGYVSHHYEKYYVCDVCVRCGITTTVKK